VTIEPLRLGNLAVWPPVILAPLAGYTDRVFREVIRELGCPFAYTEMVSAKGLILGGDNSREILERSESDSPLAVQIFGEEPETMAEAVKIIQSLKPLPQAIDINMGCPARKITSQGAGSALLKDIPRALSIVKAVKAVSLLPVTVKIRIGWDKPLDVPSLVVDLAEAGASMVAIHGRTASQGYSGKVYWSLIQEATRVSPVPVIGNGDVVSSHSVIRILELGIANGVMIGRGALSNPFIFVECERMLSNPSGTMTTTDEDRMKIAVKHFRRSLAKYGEKHGLLQMRKSLAYYVKGLRNAATLRRLINKETSPEKVLELLEKGWKVEQ
jgi:tRNA-dihydrouridine synthase B